ncbi:MAG: Uma2 family endonuclease, partial [bacterium]|nr:Uma2 family endonuclease [bacterium]
MRRMLNAPQVRRRPNLPLKRWITRAEFETLLASGVFAPEERLELLAGELVRREPVGPQHAVAVRLVQIALERALPEGYDVRPQLPLALGEYDEPFPDIAVVAGSPRDYLAEHPTTALLVVEVAEASLRTDRDIKASLYAHAGIPEYWIVNLKERVVEVYREPVSDDKAIYGASYRRRQVLRAGEVVDLVC